MKGDYEVISCGQGYVIAPKEDEGYREKYRIPLFYPYIGKKVFPAIEETLKTKWIGQGPKVDEFERAFCEKQKEKFCVAVNSGTAALHLAYILAGVRGEDDIVGPVLTCSASYHPALQQGARVQFADILPDTLCIDPEDIEKRITKKTKAIVVVHIGGYPCEMDKIMEMAKKHNLKVIEDSAQYMGKRVYPEGDYRCYSLQAIKFITTGDGGLLCMNNEPDYRRAKRLRWFDIDRKSKIKHDWQPYKDWEMRVMTMDQEEVGYKYHMNDIAASMGLAQLEDLDMVLAKRRRLVGIYREELGNVPNLKLLKPHLNETYWLFHILSVKRTEIAEALKENGVETNMAHLRCDIYKVFGGKRLDLPNMNKIESQYLCLPLHYRLTEDDVKFICEVIKHVLRNHNYPGS